MAGLQHTQSPHYHTGLHFDNHLEPSRRFFGYEDDAKTNLSTAGCTEAIFSGANLTQANLQLASCHNANFSGANLAGTEFYVNTEFPNTKYEGGVVCLGTYNGANFQNVVNFTAHEMRYPQDVNIQTQISFKECRASINAALSGNLVFNNLNDFLANNRAWYRWEYQHVQYTLTAYTNGIENNTRQNIV